MRIVILTPVLSIVSVEISTRLEAIRTTDTSAISLFDFGIRETASMERKIADDVTRISRLYINIPAEI